MQIVLFLIFIAVPILEIALFIQAGQIIGFWPTMAITVGTAIAGSFLMRVQGFATLTRFSQTAERGEIPITPVVDGIGIFAAGLLLLTPGLFTDAIGLMLFVPPFRRWLASWAFGRAMKSGRVQFKTFSTDQSGRPSGERNNPYQRGGPNSGFSKSDDVIDADFETVKPEDLRPEKDLNEEPPRDKPKSGKQNSPWRKE